MVLYNRQQTRKDVMYGAHLFDSEEVAFRQVVDMDSRIRATGNAKPFDFAAPSLGEEHWPQPARTSVDCARPDDNSAHDAAVNDGLFKFWTPCDNLVDVCISIYIVGGESRLPLEDSKVHCHFAGQSDYHHGPRYQKCKSRQSWGRPWSEPHE